MKTTEIDGVKFEITENEKNTILKSLHRDEDGFHITLTFSNDEEKRKQVEECIYNFFAREMFKE